MRDGTQTLGELGLPLNTRFIFADTETTDAKPGYKAVEVGWLEVDAEFNILDRVESLIDPQRPISLSASGIHGLVDADVADSPTIEEFFSLDAEGCYGRPIDGPSVIVGHRVAFDSLLLKPYMPGLRQEVCTLRWARRVYPHADDHKLATLKHALALPRDGSASHRVMTDIMDAYHLTKHLCERLQMTLPEFVVESAKPMFVEVFTFGKHRGTKTVDVDRGYLR